MLEAREETMEGKEKVFIDYHSLLQQFFCLSRIKLSPTTWSKKKKKIQKKKKKIYTKLH